MKSLVVNILKSSCQKDLNSLIPVFVVLRNLNSQGHSVEQAIIAALRDYGFPGADDFLHSMLDRGKILVVLDGLDEVGPGRPKVVSEIQRFCEADAQLPISRRNRVVVTCREHSYRAQDLRSVMPEAVRVESFANHHMRTFLEGWPSHKGRSALGLYALIEGDAQIRDICRNPLLLTILSGLYLEITDFQLPSSRDRFYQEAVNELLLHRPARRSITPRYRYEDKLRFLACISLDRLENYVAGEDPEEFDYATLHQFASTVFTHDLEIGALAAELLEVHGILRQITDTTFSFGHRTFQEYFAAREAARKHEPQFIVQHFCQRTDLSEVLCFYSGLARNVPQLTSILTALHAAGEYYVAGRCLLSMTELPDAAVAKLITVSLAELIKMKKGKDPAAIELLSSLSQRSDSIFDTARELFHEITHLVINSYGPQGIPALCAALSTRPETALKIVPGLLVHSSAACRCAGVTLLRDLGTEHSLDRLVLLLGENFMEKAVVAKLVAGLVKTRNDAMRKRAHLLPTRCDRTLWPLEDCFPGSLAIPLIENLSSDVPTGNRAIDSAVEARDVSTGSLEYHKDIEELADTR